MDKQKENDYTESHDDITYVVEPDILEMGGEFSVDYQNSFFARGFTVRALGGRARSGC